MDAAQRAAASNPAIGEDATEFVGYDANGNPIFKGKNTGRLVNADGGAYNGPGVTQPQQPVTQPAPESNYSAPPDGLSLISQVASAIAQNPGVRDQPASYPTLQFKSSAPTNAYLTNRSKRG